MTQISAQCADIYFYRVNGILQSELKVYLMQNGDVKGYMDSGERYHATVCTAGNYEFVAKTDPDLISLATQTVQVEPGGQYYLKLGVATGVDISSIKLMEPDKGEKEFHKGSKFTSAIRDIQLEEYGSTTIVEPTTSYTRGNISNQSPGNADGEGLLGVVEMNNFRLEGTDMRRSGELIEVDFKITNLAQQDRKLNLCAGMMSFYDENGQLYFPTKVCLANHCNYSAPPNTQTSSEYRCGSINYVASALMPSGIPLNATITIPGVLRTSTQFVRGDIWLDSEQPVRIQYGSTLFPGTVDLSDPNKKIAGNQTFQLVKAVRSGQEAVVKINAFNRSTTPHDVTIKGGRAYDDTGNVLTVSAVGFGSSNERSQNWSRRLPAVDGFPMYVILDGLPAGAKELSRLDLNFGNYELQWAGIPLEGAGEVNQADESVRDVAAAANNSQYISYTTFKEDVASREKVAGKKVILNNIYFDSGSDALQSRSYAQLQELASLLQANPDLTIEISGHTDNVGTEGSNTLLSQKRADAVRYYLIERSVVPTRMTSVGYGMNQPIDDNGSESGRQNNRRVEIKVGE